MMMSQSVPVGSLWTSLGPKTRADCHRRSSRFDLGERQELIVIRRRVSWRGHMLYSDGVKKKIKKRETADRRKSVIYTLFYWVQTVGGKFGLCGNSVRFALCVCLCESVWEKRPIMRTCEPVSDTILNTVAPPPPLGVPSWHVNDSH